MIDAKQKKEAKQNFDKYLQDGLLKKEKNETARQMYIKNAEQSLNLAEECMISPLRPHLWVVVISYYSMFYIANAVLLQLGYKTGSKIVHKVTSDALIVLVMDKIRKGLLEEYEGWVKAEKEAEKKSKLSVVVMPAKFEVLRGFVFRHSGPAIVGVKIIEGKIRKGIEVMNSQGGIVGRLHAIQTEGKAIEEAQKGMEVAVSIQDAVVGRNVFEGDELYSHIPARHFSELSAIADSFSGGELELIEEIRKMEALKA